MIISAFILAAGLGERLLPITRYLPKPLLPILGKPVLGSVLERVTATPATRIGINLHHKRTLIEQWIRTSPYGDRTEVFPEDPILGTGGALKNAEDFLSTGPFLVYNADVISDIDLKMLMDIHFSSGNIATLAVHDYPVFNKLVLDKNGFLKDVIKHTLPSPHTLAVREGSKKSPSGMERKNPHSIVPSRGERGPGEAETATFMTCAFTGIAVYQPEFLQYLPIGNSSAVAAWFNAISAGHSIGTADFTGCYWTDIGTPSSYAQAIIHALREKGENVYVHESVRECKDVALDGYIVIEKDTTLYENIALRNCITLPGTKLGQTSGDGSSTECFPTLFQEPPGDTTRAMIFENCILGPRMVLNLSESDFYEADDQGNFFIGTGGSDRKYYRARKNNNNSAVLMQCAENDPDFQRHIEYTTFFIECTIPVPALLDVKNESKSALFEDLGDLSLYSWLKCQRSADQIEAVYKKVLDILILIQTAASARVRECPLLSSRIFDYGHLRWETTYFLERFVYGLKNIRIEDRASLENEFHRLASTVDSFPKTIVHRDFQSQNIMIAKGTNLRVLDYQGARLGPPAYDVVSLLWDPYYRLDDGIRENLLDYYVDKVSDQPSFAKNVHKSLLPCRLQRHMQALGAYAYLSISKGKKYFLKYVPEGLRLLAEDAESAKTHYPVLQKLVTHLQSACM